MASMTYDVRIHKISVYKGKKVTTYYVRWKTGDKPWKEPFRNKAQAESFQSELRSAARRGEAFNLLTGRPVSWERADNDVSWYTFACAYVDMKWKDASAGYRRDIVRALTAATPAMYSSKRGRPDDAEIRKALTRWGLNTKQRAECPQGSAKVLGWLERNTKPMSALTEPSAVRTLLDTATTKLDGKRNAPSTVMRNRAVLFNAFEYAIEIKALDRNPLKELAWRAPKATKEVDRRCVINPGQARALLKAVGEQEPSGPRLVAFFAVMYYTALRPEEAIELRKRNITLPQLVWDEEAQAAVEPAEGTAWGELHFGSAAPRVGRMWTDDGRQRDARGLKHRPKNATRTVPCAPPLTAILRAHLAEIGTGPDGQLFWGVRGGELPASTYYRAWDRARKRVFSAEEYASPLAATVYDLRHACVSTWLNGGVSPTQVAEWAGHSVEVLLRTYAKCLAGQDEANKRRVLNALRS